MAEPTWDVDVWGADDSDAVRDFLDRLVTDNGDLLELSAFRWLDLGAAEHVGAVNTSKGTG